MCLATPTASGKSLVFMSVAAHCTLTDRFAKVLAIYPAKALIQDQLTKWEEALGAYGIRAGFIDGSVPTSERGAILDACRVVAMTPDVLHAWLMSHLAERQVRSFLNRLKLLVLDEAHVYDGAFGTNMAHLLRRLAVAAPVFGIISSTATVGEPQSLMAQLTGREMQVLDASHDGSSLSEKTLLLVEGGGKGHFEKTVKLICRLTEFGRARFLAFGDSRKSVERIVAATLRQRDGNQNVDDVDREDDGDVAERTLRLEHVLPFRAGYEAADRAEIQQALSKGTLAGVVSTSALELGLDIGDLDVVVLLNTPSSTKAFYQRIGRAGRRKPAVCVLIDDQHVMAPLGKYLQRSPEPSWLYLDNRYIQYANALCAAAELQALGIKSAADVELPRATREFPSFCRQRDQPDRACCSRPLRAQTTRPGNSSLRVSHPDCGRANVHSRGARSEEAGHLVLFTGASRRIPWRYLLLHGASVSRLRPGVQKGTHSRRPWQAFHNARHCFEHGVS